ncbi:hypothetical protein BDZ94DRAFT_1299257 [Collybia nuda]|uniref:UDP-glycosyltransferase n=1 Tax=Collybia nuda TaxID=64659 RepID=A0A9P6CD47_9AGAR|nr:hypothetical protein BDZ94DRAFT_1299257 [Collybia nuda]
MAALETSVLTSKHIILHAPPFWGHNKPLVAFAMVLVRARPNVILSLITTGVMYHKITDEFETKVEKEEWERLKSRINVIDITGPISNLVKPLSEFSPVYCALYNESEQGITCKSSGQTFRKLPRPAVAVVDPYAGYAFEAIRTTSQKEVPIISWVTAPIATLLHHIGPQVLGGNGPTELESDEGRKKIKMLLSGKLAGADSGAGGEAEIKLFPNIQLSELKKVTIPGAPPMYAHEFWPQLRLVPEGKMVGVGGVYMREGDGIIIVSNSVYEGETMHAMKKWFEQMGKNAYAMAPLALPNSIPEEKTDDNDENERTIRFLDSVKGKFGPQSLVYVYSSSLTNAYLLTFLATSQISFGTFSHPPQPEKLQVLIETLISHQIPFFFSHPSPQPIATLSEDLRILIQESGLGMTMQWCPQEMILGHEATGWFITHGGWNGIQESFLYKVPLIFWPISADQPMNAAQLGITHKAAFELIEVRSGEQGIKPLLRFQNTGYVPTFTVDAVRKEVEGAVMKLKGEEGQAVRANFNELCERMWRSWDVDAECGMDLDQFLKKFVD